MYFRRRPRPRDINTGLSLAQLPVYTNGGKTVTIKMKGYKWSNGETVSAQDVVFWIEPDEGERHRPGPLTPRARTSSPATS